MNQKRALKELLNGKEKVWLYFESVELCYRFFTQAYAEDFAFGDVPYDKWKTDNLIAVHADGQMGHAPYFFRMMLRSDQSEIIDYKRFIDGEQDIRYRFSAERGA